MMYISINMLNMADIIVYLNIDSKFKYEVFSFKYIINIKDKVCISIKSHTDVKLLVSNSHMLEIKKHKKRVSLFIFHIINNDAQINKMRINNSTPEFIYIKVKSRNFIILILLSLLNIKRSIIDNIII